MSRRGSCDPSTGACSNPVKADGVACDDGNACTQTDSCQAGACVGANPVVCMAADDCHLPGACNASTGTCAYAPKADGSACNDGNSCTSGDSCQAGMCVPGAASCDSLVLEEILRSGSAVPQLATTIGANVTPVVPGDPITFTANVTNTGTILDVVGEFHVTNKGSSAFAVAGYQQTLEYFSVAQQGWVPFAKLAYDAAGNLVPDATVLAMFWEGLHANDAPGVTYSANPIIGTSIGAGATASWSFHLDPLLPGNVASLIFDPSKASQIRSAIRFDTTSGPIPAPGAADLAPITGGFTGAVANASVSLTFSGTSGCGLARPGDARSDRPRHHDGVHRRRAGARARRA